MGFESDKAFMGKGSTPRIRFKFPFRQEDTAAAFITLRGMQSGSTVEKSGSEIIFGEGFVDVALSQEDTLKFDESEKIIMSIKTRLADGTVPYSPPMYTCMGGVLKEEII